LYYLGSLKIGVAESQSQLGAVASAGMDGYSSSGNWRDLKLSTSPAKVTKDRNTQTIIVAIDQRDVPTATITDSMNVLNDKVVGAYFHALGNIFSCADIRAKDVVGTFYYKEIGLVNTGKYANYNNDRIVFYSNDYSGDDFTGFVCLSSSYCLSYALTSLPLYHLVHA
jgi:hypothetical protein